MRRSDSLSQPGQYWEHYESRRLPFRRRARLHSDASIEANVALALVREAVAASV